MCVGEYREVMMSYSGDVRHIMMDVLGPCQAKGVMTGNDKRAEAWGQGPLVEQRGPTGQ